VDALLLTMLYTSHSRSSNGVNALKAQGISVSAVDFEINGSFHLPSGDSPSRCCLLVFFFSDNTAEGVRAFPPSTRQLLQICQFEPTLSTVPYSITVFAHSDGLPIRHSVNIELYAGPYIYIYIYIYIYN
jgi:hypothetical protein